MICDDLKKKLSEQMAKQAEINKDKLARGLGIDPNDHTPQTLVDHLVNNEGFDRRMLEAYMSNASTTPEGKSANKTAVDRVMDQGVDMADNLSKGDLKDAMMDMADNVRHGVKEAITRSINTRPDNGNKALNGFMGFISGESQMLPIGKTTSGADVYAGRGEAAAVQRSTDALFKQVRSELGGISKESFMESLQLIGGGRRGKDLEGSLDALNKRIDERVADKPMLKDFKAKLAVAKEVYKNPKVKDFISKYADRLDSYGDAGEKAGIIQKGDGYWHNTVALEAHSDWWDKTLNGPRVNQSDFRASKKYPSLIDMIIDSDVMPASLNFNELAGRYISNFGRAMTLEHVKERLQDNATMEMDHPDKMHLTTGDGLAPVVGMRKADGSYIKTDDGRSYKNLASVNEGFDGIHVHPDFYPWMNSNFGDFGKLNGAARAISNTGQMLKNLTLGMGFGEFSAHGASLAHKFWSLAGSQGVEGAWNPWGAAPKGISMLVNHDADVMKMIQHNMTVKQVDMISNPLLKENTPLTLVSGAEGLAMKGLNKLGITPDDMTHPLSDSVSKFTNWQHDRLFNKFQLGLKCYLAKKIPKTAWFQEMVKNKGEDYAYEQGAKMINDHFGGQNLEAIGRSKNMQLLMRTMLLAPDWLESKVSRLARIGLSDSPELRKQYAFSVLTHMAVLATFHVAIQGIYGALTGKERDGKQIWDDIKNGDLGVIHLGKSKDGKHEMVSRIDFAGTEDWRPLAKLFAAGLQSIQQGSARPVLGTAATEASYKLSPLARIPLDAMEAKKETDRYGKHNPSAFDYPGLPIPVQQAIYSMRGGYGSTPDEKQKSIAAILASVPLGASYESRNVPKEKKLGMKK